MFLNAYCARWYTIRTNSLLNAAFGVILVSLLQGTIEGNVALLFGWLFALISNLIFHMSNTLSYLKSWE